MKKRNRILALALVLLMLLSLTACGGFELRMARAARRMSKTESLHCDVHVSADVGLSLFGGSTALETALEASVDSQRDPVLAGGEARLSVLGAARELLFYAEKTGERDYTLYLSADGGASWTQHSAHLEETPVQPDLMGQLKALADLAEQFDETGEETINGVDAVTYAGVLPAETVRAAIESTGLAEKLEEALDVEIEEEGLAGPVPVTISLAEKTNDILRVTMDLSAVAGGILEQTLAALADEAGLGLMSGLGMELGVENVLLTADFSDYDSVSVQIPDEARG